MPLSIQTLTHILALYRSCGRPMGVRSFSRFTAIRRGMARSLDHLAFAAIPIRASVGHSASNTRWVASPSHCEANASTKASYLGA